MRLRLCYSAWAFGPACGFRAVATVGPCVALLLAGCNAVLGINEPLGDWDGSTGKPSPHPTTTLGTTTTTGTADGASTNDVRPAEHPFANWPMPNPPSTGLPNPQSYDTSRMPEVVFDNVTKLEWQRYVAEGGTYDWNAARAYCSALAIAGGGWRLPSRIELLSIVDFTQPGPVIDTKAFPSTPSEYFWTASPLAGDASTAWSVQFGFGTVFASPNLNTNALRVRCVR